MNRRDARKTVRNIKLWAAYVGIALAALSVRASGQSATSGPNLSTGNSLYQQCRATIRVLDASGHVPDSDYVDSAECVGYIEGFLDGYYLGAPSNAQAFCIPDKAASFGVFARLYVQYMDKYPKLLDEEKPEGLVGMLIANYPCPKAPAQ
ncbi:MAG TPA: Rap1a/Tai family immunity protein [Terracidiphilus sp.]|nr:Rap1a/Tai family immunity protein [Terracidiphilus sp.]